MGHSDSCIVFYMYVTVMCVLMCSNGYRFVCHVLSTRTRCTCVSAHNVNSQAVLHP